MPGVAFEVLLILALIVANGLFALSELAVVSSRKARLQQWAEEGDRGAAVALELANAPNRFLSAVQIGITLVGILTGVFSGAAVARAVADAAGRVPFLAPYRGALGVGLVVAATTYLSLVIGELVPKRLALASPERIAARVAGPMRWLARVAAPLVWLLNVSSSAVAHLFRAGQPAEPPVTEEELKLILRQGTEAGVFEQAEQQMVERVFRFTDRRVGTLGTPRREVSWLELSRDPAEVRARLVEHPHSHYAVCEGGPDHVVGIVHAKDLLARCLEGQPLDIRAALHPVLFVPESSRATRLLELFRERKTHVAVVVDEHGGTQGLVTLVDLMEAIVGEIPLPGEEERPHAVRRPDGSWLVDGLLAIDELRDLLHIRHFPDEDGGDYGTAGGFIATYLGRIPRAGDHFEWHGWRFEVADMDGLRVDKLLITPLAAAHQPAE